MDCGAVTWRTVRTICLTVLLFVTYSQVTAMAQESEVTLETLLHRMKRLEDDNQQLREKVDRIEGSAATTADAEGVNIDVVSEVLATPAASSGRVSQGRMYVSTDPGVLFADVGIEPLLTDAAVRKIVAEEIAHCENSARTTTEVWQPPVDSIQDKQIAELDTAFRSFQSNATRKVFPNVTVNGVFQADAGWIHQDVASETQYGQIQDGADFRRARLSAKGSVTDLTNYFFQMDFGFFGRPTFTDVWLEQTKVPLLGNVRIGQWKQPFGLEVVSSFRYTTFMERSVLFQPFTPFRRLGIGFYDNSDDLSTTWAASVFRSGQDQYGGTLSSDGGYGTAERITLVPSWECNGKQYLHLGVGHFFNAPPDDSINFRTIPEFFVGANGPGAVGTSGQAVPGGSNGTPFFVSTGNVTVPYFNVLGSELLWVNGPVSLQSEAMVTLVGQGRGSTSVLPGAYAQAGYFLTGEHRPYDRKTATIDRVIPKSNLAFHGTCGSPGIGAWEVAGRWSYLDLNDSAIQGGTLMDYTAGVNWYWNPYTKIVFNYVHAISDGPTYPKTQTDMFGIRAQLDF